VRTLLLNAQDVGAARAEAARVCIASGVTGSRTDSLSVVVSELLGNALLHGVRPIHYDIRADGTDLLVEVDDDSDTPPGRRTQAEQLAESGRGLLLVDKLARRWGILATPTGKRVWARV